jgi:hypothetical protein
MRQLTEQLNHNEIQAEHDYPGDRKGASPSTFEIVAITDETGDQQNDQRQNTKGLCTRQTVKREKKPVT